MRGRPGPPARAASPPKRHWPGPPARAASLARGGWRDRLFGDSAAGGDGPGVLRLAAVAGVATMALTSTGDLLAVGVLLGLIAADVLAGAVAVTAAVATLARWSSSSLTALAGGQAVLGPAGWTGAVPLALSSWAACAALVLVAPPERPAAVAYGLVAAVIVAGPALGEGSVVDALVRFGASIGAVAATLAVARTVPRNVARLVAAGLAAFALFLTVAPAATAG